MWVLALAPPEMHSKYGGMEARYIHAYTHTERAPPERHPEHGGMEGGPVRSAR